MGKRTIIPFGPQHPVLPEPVHLDLVMEDEKVVDVIPSIGYIHRGLEKLVEKKEYTEMKLEDLEDGLRSVKCRGKIFPLGWWHLIRSMYTHYEENLELLLVAVSPEYQKKGITALVITDMMSEAIKGHFVYAETNAELEDNSNMRTIWNGFDYDQCKRRRSYTKTLY